MKKTNVWLLVWALLVSSTAFVSCDDDDNDEAMEQDRMRVEAFLNNAAQSDMFEIQTGNMAKMKGSRADVRTFGEQLVTDHTKTSQQIMSMAQKRNMALNTNLPPAKMTIVNRLNSESGTTFDRDFAAVQVQSHQEAITLFETADKEIMDAEVQTFIDANLPVLRMHLQHAQTLKTAVDRM